MTRTDQVAQLCRLIETSEREPRLADLARAVGLSPFHTQREFKRVTGLTPKAYAAAHRAQKARRALKERPTVTEALLDAGFSGPARFYEQSKAMLGMTPTQFRRGGQAQVIRFAVGQCSLGAVLVAATRQGVCAIFLGDEPQALVNDLERRFPKAQLVGADACFERVVAQVVGIVESGGTGEELPLDIRGTAFQQRVWTALLKVPRGTTTTYAELARAMGSPKAVRAVAGACAANALAVAIPCHRVVRTDGNVSGYRWGVARKAELLRRESGR